MHFSSSSYSKMCNLCTVEGTDTLDGYRNLNLIDNTAPECIRPRTGTNDVCSSCLYIGPNVDFGQGLAQSRIILVDCLMEKIKLNEQRSLQATKRSLQNARAIIQMRKRYISKSKNFFIVVSG